MLGELFHSWGNFEGKLKHEPNILTWGVNENMRQKWKIHIKLFVGGCGPKWKDCIGKLVMNNVWNYYK